MKYVGTYSDPKDIVTKDKLEAVASRVSTNEDNIAMAESDIEGLQTSVGTLQTNVGNIQTALTSKQDTVVGGASTITENNLTASRALVSNSSGKVAVSNITSTELGYLDGVTSNVQTQLSGKQSTISVSGILKGTGNGNIEAAVAGTDYLAESDLYICTVTESGTSYTADKTPIELLTASRAGKLVVAKLNEAVYFFDGGNSQMALFTRVQDANVYGLRVTIGGTVILATTKLQEAALITNLEANKDNNTSYPSAKAVYDAIPHPDTKTDNQTQVVGVDTSGKLWTNASSVTSVNGKTGAVQLDAADVGALLSPISETTSTSLTGILKGNGTTVEIAAPGTDYLNTAVFTVTCTKDADQSTDGITVYTPDCTFDEMLSAYNSGMVIELMCGFIFRLLGMIGTTGALFTTIGPTANLNTQTASWSAANNKVNVTKSSLATLDIVYSAIGRSSYVNMGDTNYTNYMARGEALFSSETTPTVNGCIAWQYE